MEKYTKEDWGKVLIEYTGDTKSMFEAIIDYATEFGFDESKVNDSEYNLDDADDKELAYLWLLSADACGYLTELQCAHSGMAIWQDDTNGNLVVMQHSWF
jgi:hypothetical protein